MWTKFVNNASISGSITLNLGGVISLLHTGIVFTQC